MGTRALQEEAIRQAERTIRAVVGQLVRSSGILESDADDLAQILRIHVAKRACGYDPARASLRTFIERIVANRVRDYRDAQFAQVRDEGCRARSLDEASGEGEDGDEPLGGLLDIQDALRRAAMLPWAVDDDLAMDVRAALEDLSEIDRDTCAALATTKSLREAADELQVHVETLRERVARIRVRFERRNIHGTRDYRF